MATKANKRMTKAQIVGELSDRTGLTKKDVNAVFEGLRDVIKRELGKRGPGEFVIPDLLKLKTKNVKAQKGGEKKVNPFTGDEILTKPKPAHRKVRATALKKLKDLIQ